MTTRPKICRLAKDVANELLLSNETVRRITIIPPDTVDDLTDEDNLEDDADDLAMGAASAPEIAGMYEIEYENNVENVEEEEAVAIQRNCKMGGG